MLKFSWSQIGFHSWSSTCIWLMCSDHAIFVALCQTVWSQAKAHREGSLWQMHLSFFSVLYLALNRVTISCWNHHTYLIPILFSVRFGQRADRRAEACRSKKTSYLGFVKTCWVTLGWGWSLPLEVFKHELRNMGILYLGCERYRGEEWWLE